MFKQAIIHYPTDERLMKQISKDISALHCTAAVTYMDTLNLSERQKTTLLTCVAEDLAATRT